MFSNRNSKIIISSILHLTFSLLALFIFIFLFAFIISVFINLINIVHHQVFF